MTTFPLFGAVLAMLPGARRPDLISTAQRAVLERMRAAVVVIDRHGRIRELNAAAIGLLGKPGEDALGQTAAEVLSGWPTIADTQLDSQSAHATVRIMDVAGERILDVQNTPIRGGDGALLGRLVLVDDVTERFRLEVERAARQQAEAGRRKAALLADISTRLAHPLDLDSILSRLPRSIVPAFADGLVLDLLAGSGLGEQRVAAHVTDEGQRRLWQACLARDVSALQPLLIENVGAATLDTRDTDAWRDIGARSVIRVPLTIDCQLVGVLHLVASGRAFDAADLVFAEDLAERCALAFDNVRRLKDVGWRVAAQTA